MKSQSGKIRTKCSFLNWNFTGTFWRWLVEHGVYEDVTGGMVYEICHLFVIYLCLNIRMKIFFGSQFIHNPRSCVFWKVCLQCDILLMCRYQSWNWRLSVAWLLIECLHTLSFEPMGRYISFHANIHESEEKVKVHLLYF